MTRPTVEDVLDELSEKGLLDRMLDDAVKHGHATIITDLGTDVLLLANWCAQQYVIETGNALPTGPALMREDGAIVHVFDATREGEKQ